jgi:flagellar motor switch protein FliN/FliY
MSQEDIRPAAAELQTLGDSIQSAPVQEVAAKVGAGQKPRHLETILQIPVSVKVVLGSASMPVSSVLKLGRGAVVPLDRKVGEPVDVVVNGRVIARGEVVVLDEDNSRFGVSLTEVIGAAPAPTRVA